MGVSRPAPVAAILPSSDRADSREGRSFSQIVSLARQRIGKIPQLARLDHRTTHPTQTQTTVMQPKTADAGPPEHRPMQPLPNCNENRDPKQT